MTAPASFSVARPRRWIEESGVSRGTRTSVRRSLRATDAARWMRFCIAPEASVPTVAIEHGQMTYASTRADPLAYGLRKSFSPYTVTCEAMFPTKRSSTSSRASEGSRYSSVASTSIPEREAHRPMSQSTAASARSSRSAYGAPEAPVTPRKTRTARRLLPQSFCGPFEAARNAPSAARFSSPRYEYDPITLFPNAAGLVRYWTKKAASLDSPIDDRLGAPSWPAPWPRYVWQLRHPD